MDNQKYALITGYSTGGIGHAVALDFVRRGIHTFATARNLDKMADLKELPNVTLLQPDVTSPESVAAAVKAVSAQTDGRLDYLVNNAGVSYQMPAIDLDVEKAKALYDVNFWGYVRVAKAFAPLLIEAKGAIANIGSIAALTNFPFLSMYASSKAAVNLYSEALRLELAPLGVRVLTVMAGSIATRMRDNAVLDPLPAGSRYQAAAAEIDAVRRDPPAGLQSDVHDFAREVVDDAVGGASGRVYRGAMAGVAKILAAFLPTWIWDRMSVQNRGLEKVHP